MARTTRYLFGRLFALLALVVLLTAGPAASWVDAGPLTLAGIPICHQELPTGDHPQPGDQQHDCGLCTLCAVRGTADLALIATPPTVPLPRPAEIAAPLPAPRAVPIILATRQNAQPRAPPAAA